MSLQPRIGPGDDGVLLHAAPELVRFRQAVREAAGVGAVAAPVGQFLGTHGLIAAGGILPGQTRLGIEHRDVGQLASRIFLQPRAISGTWSSGNSTILWLVPIAATVSPDTVAIAQASFGISTFSTCLPLRVLPTQSSSLTTKPWPSRLATRNLRPPLWTNSDTSAASCSMSMNIRIG